MTQTLDQQLVTQSDKSKGTIKQHSRKEIERQAAEETEQSAKATAERFKQAITAGVAGIESWWKAAVAQPPDAVASAITNKWDELEPTFQLAVVSLSHMRSLPIDTGIPIQLSLSLALSFVDKDKAQNLLVIACNGIVGNGTRAPGGRHLKTFQHYMLSGGVPALTRFDFARPSFERKNLLACIAATFPRTDDQAAKHTSTAKSTDKHPSHEHEPPLVQWLLNSGLFGQMSDEHQKRIATRASLWPDDMKNKFLSRFASEDSSRKLPQDLAQALKAESVQIVTGTNFEPSSDGQSQTTVPTSPISEPIVVTVESGAQQVRGKISAAELLKRAEDLQGLLHAYSEAREQDLRTAAHSLDKARQDAHILHKKYDLENLNRKRVEEENVILRLKLSETESGLRDAEAQVLEFRQQVTRLIDDQTSAQIKARQTDDRLAAEETRHRQNLQDMRERFERDKRGEVQVFINGLSDKLQLEWREFHAGNGRQMDAESGTSLRKFVQRMFDMLEREGLKFRK